MNRNWSLATGPLSLAGVNLERLNADPAGPGWHDYAGLVGGPVGCTLAALAARLFVRAKTLPTAAAEQSNTVLGAEAGRLAAAGQTAKARAILEAQDKISGAVK